VILHGPELFLHVLHTQALREALARAGGQVDEVRFDGQSASPADVLDECRSFGLMAPRKLVVVDNADQLVKESARPLFERYAQNPCEMATLVLRATRWHPGRLDELVAKVGAVVRCEPPGPEEAVDRAVELARSRHNARLERDAAVALVERVGPDLGLLDSEIEKLATAATQPDQPGSASVITPALVSALTGRTREEEVWDIQQALLSGDAAQTLARLRDMLVISRHPTPALSWAFMDLARKLHSLSRAIHAGRNPWSLRQTLRLWGPSADRITEVSRRVDPDRALRLFRAAVEADARAKSGYGSAERGLEVLALRFAALTGRRGPLTGGPAARR
jgi:DNA polymerase-3 subunit delta